MRAIVRHALLALLSASLVGCAPPNRGLVSVPMPELRDLEPAVREAVVRARSDFDRLAATKPRDDVLADAYGELAMTYHAHSLVAATEAAYANARTLAPRDKRWPYLLGHVYNDSSKVPEALRAFEASQAIDGDDPAILFSLGEAYLQLGDLDQAKVAYEKLHAHEDDRAAAAAGLGKVALAQHRYQEAVSDFEEALKLWPAAVRLRQPLAMAYKGVGDDAKAEQNLRQYVNDGIAPEVADPMADAVAAKVVSSHALMRRAHGFSKAGRFDLAEGALRTAVEADPRNPDAVAGLGISLANQGRLDEAEKELVKALALDDHNATAHLSLAVVFDREGNDQMATEHYAKALSFDPTNVQAMVYLADAKMRHGMTVEAVSLYGEAVRRVPTSSHLRISLAIANIKAGQYAEARAELEAAHAAQPENPAATNALARLLATAMRSAVRDGSKSLRLSKALFEQAKTYDAAQTYAMALAETGAFEQAVMLQREIIASYTASDGSGTKAFLERNLRLFEKHRASREGWAPDDPLFQPRSPATRLARTP